MAYSTSKIRAGLHPSAIDLAPTVATALTAAGTTQAGALALTAEANIIGTAAASTGVRLPNIAVNDEMYVMNGGANAVLVYPPVGHQINTLAANAGFSLAAARAAKFERLTATRWVAFGS